MNSMDGMQGLPAEQQQQLMQAIEQMQVRDRYDVYQQRYRGGLRVT